MQIKKGLNKLVDRVEKTNIYIIFVVILCIQVLFMLYYCNMKKGYFVDEIWSYGLSNSYYHAQLEDNNSLENVKISSELFKKYLTVDEGKNFKFGSVVNNQMHDAHPPLFYMVLHSVSSLFTGTFSKWFGLIPNIIYFVIVMFLLLKISQCVSDNNIFFIAVQVLYGFSIGAINSVTYIRMYMLLTLWCLLFLLENIYLYQKEKLKLSNYILLGIATLGGMYTHFFFIIFACPVVLLNLLYLYKEKSGKGLLKYILKGAIGGISAILLFPTYIQKISGNDGNSNSAQTHANMRNFSDWSNRLKAYWADVSSELFGSVWGVIIGICVIIIISYIFSRMIFNIKLKKTEKGLICIIIEKNDFEKKEIVIRKNVFIIVGILFICAFYYILVCKITLFISNRFMMCIYPLLVLLMCLLLEITVKVCTKKKVKRAFAMGIISILIIGVTFYANDPEYIYEEKGVIATELENYTDVPCLYVYTAPYRMLNNALNLMNTKTIYQSNLDNLKKNINSVDNSSEQLILYVDTLVSDQGMEMDDCVEYIKSSLNYNKVKWLGTDDMSVIYCLER